MTIHGLHTSIHRSALRLIALVLTVVMLFTMDAIALTTDSLRAVYELSQQTFTLTPEQGVTVELSGMLPVNGSADAKTVDADGEDVLHAYDITIRYQNGREFEPSEGEPISVSFQSDSIAQANKDSGTTLEVAHIPDNGEEEEVELLSAEGDTASFEAESFSVYLIRTHTGDTVNHNPRRIYHFLSPEFSTVEREGVLDHYRAPVYEFPNKLNDKVTTQAIRSGESLQEIVLPQNSNSGLFYGWYVVQCSGETEEVTDDEGVTRTNYIYHWGNGAPEHVEFNEPISFPDATQDEDIYLAPLFGRYRFLTFHQDTKGSENENIIVSRKLIALGDDRKCTLSISDVRAPSTDPNKIIFWGWEFTHVDGDTLKGETEVKQTVTTEGEEIPETITIEDKNIINGVQPTSEEMRHMIYDIWPIFKEARWVEFEVGGHGASYRPPQFILLDEDTTGFHNVPTRPGYDFDGWYFGSEENMVTDENADILNVTKQLSDTMSIQNGKLIITNEAEGTSASRVFHAKWTPKQTADFTVIVWKQKVTDTKHSGEEGYPEKTYDFAGYYPEEGRTLSGRTDLDPRQCPAYLNYEGNNKGFGDFASTRNDITADNNFVGFHFSHADISDDGYNHPEYENKINPNGSTVVNVYYDRDLMQITFHYKSSAVSGSTTSGDYVYLRTTDNTGEQYGLVNGEYVPLALTSEISANSYSFSTKYSLSTAQEQIMYALIGGEYVELTSQPIYQWQTKVTNPGGWFSSDKYGYYLPATSNSGTQYGIFNGSFNEIYKSGNRWYQNKSGWINPTYSNEYTGTRYSLNETETSSKAYSGALYTITNNQLTETSATSGTLYGIFDNGRIYQIEKSDTIIGYQYTYNGAAYTGDRYAADFDNTSYSGTLYRKTANGFVETTDDNGEGDIYGSRTEGIYEVLTRQDAERVYTWRTENGSEYTGNRYLRFHRSSDSSYPYEVVWEGLYGRTFAQNGYSFPAEYRWEESSSGGQGQTLLSGFTNLNDSNTATNRDYHLYHVGAAAAGTMYHMRQKLDGTYSRDESNSSLAHVTSTNSVTFNFSNKFPGFSVIGYSTTQLTSVSENGGTVGFHAAVAGDSASINTQSYTYYVYHKRRKDLTLNFNDNYTGGSYREVQGLWYDQSIAGYANVYTPAPRPHYTFEGWYEDSTCTKEFNFNTTITASKIIYAKWTKERYRVMVDPNGGEFPLGGSSSTFFNINYDELVGEYANTRCLYVPSDQGEYVYANFQYDKVNSFPGVAAQPKGLASVYRKAFYLHKNDIDNFYKRPFTVDGVSYCYKDSGMTLEEFKSCINMNELYSPVSGDMSYELVSWHKVRADGTEERIPFNFKSLITEDTTIRAHWVQHGGYALTYSPTMTSTGITGTMARYNDPMDDTRKYADKAPVVILAEPSNITTTGAGGHEGDAEDYIFRGWRIVDGTTREPLENNVFYDPGETMILNATHAGPQGVIHMEAYYEKRANTVRRTDVAGLTLDANSPTASVNAQELKGDRTEYADTINNRIKIERQINNFDLNLQKYIKNFSNSDGSLLVGWNTTPDPGTYIPEFYADGEIGVNKTAAASPPQNINTLYAVWEPMIYLTLNNTTSQPVNFNLKFKNYNGSVYEGYANTMTTDELQRTPFSDESFVTKNSSGDFDVQLPAKTLIKLVIPEGVLADGAGSYTVTGTYARSNTKDLFVYNSGSDTGVSVECNGGNWKLNGSAAPTGDPITYTTSGTLVKGAQGRLVRFVEQNSGVDLHLKSRYYDLEHKEWTDVTDGCDVNEKIRFVLSGTSSPDATASHSADATMKMIDNDNHTITFGMEVTEFNSDKYKFIGWYMTPEAAPNAYSVDRHAKDFGEETVDPILAVPPQETTYYALFVPYIKGSLTLTHSQRADSAGDCAEENGVGLRVQYYTSDAPNSYEVIGSHHGDKDDPAKVTLSEQYIYEKNTTGHLRVSVRAKPAENSTYKASYRNQEIIPGRSVEHDDLEGEGFFYAVFDKPVSDRFVPSDTVKGLMELRTVNYYSIFSRAFDITYNYTARDGQSKEYKLAGSVDSFDDFELYVIEHTPYVRTLAGDIVWDTDNMVMNVDEHGMHAVLNEVGNVRSRCTVTIIEKGGYTPTVLVPYGETFTEAQAQAHLAPSVNDTGQIFDYWDIKNTDTGEHIANCYSEKFTFVVWNNYTITPHYTDAPSTIKEEGQSITIDYIDTSRNPWGNAAYNNNEDTTDRSDVTDKVVADLDISFINNGDKILDAVDENGNNLYKLGVMFEICGSTEDGSFEPSAYQDGESGRASRVATLVNANTKPSSSATIGGVRCYFTKIAINENTVSTFNRSEFSRSFTTASVKNNVFRMYAYMITPEGNTILSDPHYLTLYNYAAPEYAIPTRSKSAGN